MESLFIKKISEGRFAFNIGLSFSSQGNPFYFINYAYLGNHASIGNNIGRFSDLKDCVNYLNENKEKLKNEIIETYKIDISKEDKKNDMFEMLKYQLN